MANLPVKARPCPPKTKWSNTRSTRLQMLVREPCSVLKICSSRTQRLMTLHWRAWVCRVSCIELTRKYSIQRSTLSTPSSVRWRGTVVSQWRIRLKDFLTCRGPRLRLMTPKLKLRKNVKRINILKPDHHLPRTLFRRILNQMYLRQSSQGRRILAQNLMQFWPWEIHLRPMSFLQELEQTLSVHQPIEEEQLKSI